jgi:hypothetical protein
MRYGAPIGLESWGEMLSVGENGGLKDGFKSVVGRKWFIRLFHQTDLEITNFSYSRLCRQCYVLQEGDGGGNRDETAYALGFMIYHSVY